MILAHAEAERNTKTAMAEMNREKKGKISSFFCKIAIDIEKALG